MRVMPSVVALGALAASLLAGGDTWAQKVYSTVAPVQARTRVAMDLRSGPHVSHAVVARVARASWVEVRGCGVPEGWCEVVHQGRSAWGLADAIERGGPSAGDTGAPPDAGAPTTGPADPPIVIVVEPGRPPRGRH